MMERIKVKRVYDPPTPDDGERYLIDRLWPRGVSKEKLRLTAWLKDVAPGHELRRWFHRHRDAWDEFVERYRAELDANPGAWQPLIEAARRGTITLLYASRDRERNNAVVLAEYLREKMPSFGAGD